MGHRSELADKYILLSVRIREENGGQYTAFCDELGVSACAATKTMAEERL